MGLRLVSIASGPWLAPLGYWLPGSGVINRRGFVVVAVFIIALVDLSLQQFGP
jgi:hypothetical protein